MKIILLFILIWVSYLVANKSTNDYISQFNKENKFFKPLVGLGKTAIALVSLIIILSLWHICFNYEIVEINILTFSALGIIISVLLTITHNFYIKEEDKIKEIINNDREIKNLLLSLKDEINLVWAHFKDDVEEHMHSETIKANGFTLFIEITMDYFVIYNNNTEKIGKIDNKDLREKIIFIHIKAKSLIDSLLLNNKMINDSIKYRGDKQLIEIYTSEMINYGMLLQNKYDELDSNIKEVNVLFNSVLEDARK